MKSLEVLRHIELPYSFNNNNTYTISGLNFNQGWTLSQSIPCLRIERNKYFQIKNFSIIPISLNAYLGTGSNLDIQSIDSPLFQIFGLQNENMSFVLNQWNATTYQYNGINDNPDLNISTEDILPYNYNNLLTRNYLVTSGSVTLNPLNEYPLNQSNVIAQKSLGIIEKPTSSTALLNIIPNQYFSNFSFINANYTRLLFPLKPSNIRPQNNNNMDIDIISTGIISFDLLQYPSGL
mgnify:CR=1 FL=1